MRIRKTNGLFDEAPRIAQSSFAMKWCGISLIAVMFGLSGWAADTNSPTVDTNLSNAPDLVYSPMTNNLIAETNAPENVRQLSLDDCIELALKHNVELQIDRYNPAIALYTLNLQYGGYDPVAHFSGQHAHSVASTRVFGNNIIGSSTSDGDSFNTSLSGLLPLGTTYNLQGSIAQTAIQNPGSAPVNNSSGSVLGTVTQPLLKNFWIDSTRLAISVDKNRLKHSQLQLKLNIMQTITTLEQAYYDLIYDRENVLVQEAAAAYTDRQLLESKKKLEIGALAPLDLASAEAQAAQNRAAIISAMSQLGTQERTVKQLITDQYSKWADVELKPVGTLVAPKMAFNRQDSWARALTQRPEYLQAKLDAEKDGIQLKYDWNQLFPELDVIGTYGYNGSGTVYSGAFYDIQQMNRPSYSFGGQITMPLANVSARNTYKSDKVTLQQDVLTIKKWERDIMMKIDNDIATLQSDYDSVQANYVNRQYTEQALEAEQKKLDNGSSTLYQVILHQRDLTTARGQEIQALDNYNKDLAQLSLDEGSTLERLGIDFSVR